MPLPRWQPPTSSWDLLLYHDDVSRKLRHERAGLPRAHAPRRISRRRLPGSAFGKMAAAAESGGARRSKKEAGSGFLGLRPTSVDPALRRRRRGPRNKKRGWRRLAQEPLGLEVDQYLEDVRLQERTSGCVGGTSGSRGQSVAEQVWGALGSPGHHNGHRRASQRVAWGLRMRVWGGLVHVTRLGP